MDGNRLYNQCPRQDSDGDFSHYRAKALCTRYLSIVIISLGDSLISKIDRRKLWLKIS